MKRILITGADSYIGTSFEKWMTQYDGYVIDTVDMKNDEWEKKSFSGYDIVFHVAGIAHTDAKKGMESFYYKINRDLTVNVARKAKNEDVHQFIFMSSIIVYGNKNSIKEAQLITKDVQPEPDSFYGMSKLLAEQELLKLQSEYFNVVILRPPMIYGPGSKGNYKKLLKLIMIAPIFPEFKNQRSMLFIDNLCKFVYLMIKNKEHGIFYPQNNSLISTSDLVRYITRVHGRNIKFTRAWNPVIRLIGDKNKYLGKLFGSLAYSKSMSSYKENYMVVDFKESLRITEGVNRSENSSNAYKFEAQKIKNKTIWIIDHYSSEPKYGGISRQYDFAVELSKRGYHIVIISSSFSHFTHSYISRKKTMISNINSNMHYIYLKTSSYKKNDGLNRFVNMISFMRSVIKYKTKIADRFGKPDVVTGCSVHPFAWRAAYNVANKYNARFCVEVRDLWPAIWVLNGEKHLYHPMVVFFAMLERWAYKSADRIIYSMQHGDRYICDELGFDRYKAFLIGQPMDCKRFDENSKSNELLIPESIREFMKDSFNCVFSGYYMDYEGVYTMLEAAEKLKRHNIPVKMVFVGSGQEKEGMINYAAHHKLHNVYISDRISKEAVPSLLKKSDICMAHLSIQGHDDAYKYGVSKNKIIEYLYSGTCILFGFAYQDDIVAESGAGYVFRPFDSEELFIKIKEIFNMTKVEREEMGENGRKFIIQNHSAEKLVDKLEEILFGN